MTLTRVRAQPRITDLANRVASHPKMEKAVMGAIRASLPGVVESVLRDMFPGESVTLYVPRTGKEDRQDRDAQIVAALSAGEAHLSIAKRLRTSLRHVERVSGRRNRQFAP